FFVFFFQAEDGIRDGHVTGVQTCALPIFPPILAARRASLARLGPILPPAPKIKRSPSMAFIAEATASLGRERRSSNSATFWIFIVIPAQNRLWRKSPFRSRADPSRAPCAPNAASD